MTTLDKLTEILEPYAVYLRNHEVGADKVILKQAIIALIDEAVVAGRIDELTDLNFRIAENGWHKENAYKMFPYILDRIATLTKENGEE